jgi:hypothetical protein
MTTKDHCPLCGALSFEGKVCEPMCDPGNLHHAGIDLLPMESSYRDFEENYSLRRTPVISSRPVVPISFGQEF